MHRDADDLIACILAQTFCRASSDFKRRSKKCKMWPLAFDEL